MSSAGHYGPDMDKWPFVKTEETSNLLDVLEKIAEKRQEEATESPKRYFCYMTEEGQILRDTKADTELECLWFFLAHCSAQEDKDTIFNFESYKNLPDLSYDRSMLELAIKYLGVCNGRIVPFTGENDSSMDNDYIREMKGLQPTRDHR